MYTVGDGTSTDTANLTITVTGINDDPAAVNDTDSVNEDATVTKTGSQDDVLNDDTDADDSASLVVTNIQPVEDQVQQFLLVLLIVMVHQ